MKGPPDRAQCEQRPPTRHPTLDQLDLSRPATPKATSGRSDETAGGRGAGSALHVR
jgi:hypothetical protein